MGTIKRLYKYAICSIKEEWEEENRKPDKSWWSEYLRRDRVDDVREATPCLFKEGISYEEFENMVHSCIKKNGRIIRCSVKGPIVYCTVRSQSGNSTWNFSLDFNNWGHIEGTFWSDTDNKDSDIPNKFGREISSTIHSTLREKDILIPDFSEYIDNNELLDSPNELSYSINVNIFKRLFAQDKKAKMDFSSRSLIGEHIYAVVSYFKHKGFTDVECTPVEDIDAASDFYALQTAEIIIEGEEEFKRGALIDKSDYVEIKYHTNRKYKVPKLKRLKKRHYQKIVDDLYDIGFNNIYTREINDLITGFITHDGTVEKVLVKINGVEQLMEKNYLYDFNTKIIVCYHTFKNKR